MFPSASAVPVPGQGPLANNLHPTSYHMSSERSGGGMMSDDVGNAADAAEGASVEIAMAVLEEPHHAPSARSVDEDEDDFADDVVVFRPAFSRPVDTPSPSFSPSTSASSLNAMMGTSLLSATPSIPMNIGERMIAGAGAGVAGGGGNGLINAHAVGEVVHMSTSNTPGSSTGSSLSIVNKNKNNDPSIAYLASTLGVPGHAGSAGAAGAAGGSTHVPHVLNFDEVQSFLGGTCAPSRPPLPTTTASSLPLPVFTSSSSASSHVYGSMGGSSGGGPPGLPPPGQRLVAPPPGTP